MSQNNYMEGKRSSFWELTQENAVIIPIIQRDYAQGRENDDVRQIRSKFVKQLLISLAEGKTSELDFVYGSLEAPDTIASPGAMDKDFTPLDGQQRLTTLFLLHWFLALWNDNDFKLFKEHIHGRFGYKTRSSSMDFCEKLTEECTPATILELVFAGEPDPVSRALKDSGWFHDAWMNDPTIKGMLVMLDTISQEFRKYKGQAHQFFLKLIGMKEDGSMTTPLITFNLLYLNQGEVRISDGLYIKMNSRGKPLTDFETFKARFETFLRKETSVGSKEFSNHIDHEWADAFWSIRNDVKPRLDNVGGRFARENTDAMMMNLIKVTIASEYASLMDETMPVLDILFETKAAKDRKEDLHLTYFRYSEELGVLNEIAGNSKLDPKEKEILKKRNDRIGQAVFDSFQFICDLVGECQKCFKVDERYLNWQECIDKVLFDAVDGENDSQYKNLTYGDRLLFYAYSQYCIRFKDKLVKNTSGENHALDRWMRFIRNINESVEINRPDEMRKLFCAVDDILTKMKCGGSDDISVFLCSLTASPDWAPVPDTQVREEIMKARLSKDCPDWEKAIDLADNTKEWPGRSGYLLYFSGVTAYDLMNINQITDPERQACLDLFIRYRDHMAALLNSIEKKPGFSIPVSDGGALVERALLSKGNYMRKESGGTYSMMDTSLSGRTYSIRQLLQYNGISGFSSEEKPVEDSSVYKEGVDCLKKVFDDPGFKVDKETIEGKDFFFVPADSLKEIIDNSISSLPDYDWRKPMLSDPRLWGRDLSENRFFWLDDNGRGRIPHKTGGKSSRYESVSLKLFLDIKDLFDKHNIIPGKTRVDFHFWYHRNADPDGLRITSVLDGRKYNLCIHFNHDTKKWDFKCKIVDERGYEQDASPEFVTNISKHLGYNLPMALESRKKAMWKALILHARIRNSQNAI